MIINIGSKNPVKIRAVEEVLKENNFFKNFKINSINSSSNVSNQPTSLEETLSGAKNRAINCFENCAYSFGLESGLININQKEIYHMCFSVCSIYDGNYHSIGFSPAFPLPLSFSEMINKGEELDTVAYLQGETKNKRVGYDKGIVSVWTKEKITRKDFLKPSIQMALIPLQNKDLFHIK